MAGSSRARTVDLGPRRRRVFREGLTSFLDQDVDYSSGLRGSHLKRGVCITLNGLCRSVVFETVITTVSPTLGRWWLVDGSS